MIVWCEIGFPNTVAVASAQQFSGPIDAKTFDDISRPAPAIALYGEPLLGPEDAVIKVGLYVAPEVGFAAEQSEPVLDLPCDRHRIGILRDRGLRRPG